MTKKAEYFCKFMHKFFSLKESDFKMHESMEEISKYL